MTGQADAGGHADGAAAETADEFRLSESPAHLLRRAQQFSSGVFQQAGLADGVTLRQSLVLAAISEAEGKSQSDLVRATGVDRSTLADMIARMERKGLITRVKSDADGRAKSVSLTEAGRSRLEDALPAMRQADAALLAALPANRRKSFRETLGVLARAAGEAELEEGDSKVRRKAEKAMAKADRKRRKKHRRKD